MGQARQKCFQPIQQKSLPRERKFPTGQASECFLKAGTTPEPNRETTQILSEKFFLPKVYSRKHSVSPTSMVTAVSGQLDTPGCYRVFNQLQLRTSSTEYWSHIPQDLGRRGGTRSGDCRIDDKSQEFYLLSGTCY